MISSVNCLFFTFTQQTIILFYLTYTSQNTSNYTSQNTSNYTRRACTRSYILYESKQASIQASTQVNAKTSTQVSTQIVSTTYVSQH